MKVHELIAALNGCNPDADVEMADGMELSDITINHDGSKVFIVDTIDDSYDEPTCIGCGGCGCHGDCQK
jgi:hypothetical protein